MRIDIRFTWNEEIDSDLTDVIYPELCDQRKRTEETLEKILELIKETI